MVAASHAQFGAVPDWIAAIGTTLAFFVAFAVLMLDLKERNRRQAGQVSAWFERIESKATLHVLNSSETPVYKVCVIPQLAGTTYDTKRFPLLAPKSEYTPLTLNLPGAEHISNEFLGVQIFFEDGTGRRWQRARNGKLQRRWRAYQ
jgi:hypothetical protein